MLIFYKKEVIKDILEHKWCPSCKNVFTEIQALENHMKHCLDNTNEYLVLRVPKHCKLEQSRLKKTIINKITFGFGLFKEKRKSPLEALLRVEELLTQTAPMGFHASALEKTWTETAQWHYDNQEFSKAMRLIIDQKAPEFLMFEEDDKLLFPKKKKIVLEPNYFGEVGENIIPEDFSSWDVVRALKQVNAASASGISGISFDHIKLTGKKNNFPELFANFCNSMI